MATIDAARAKALVGIPFRPQGRDPARGLDCVGAVLAACELKPEAVRDDYRLRGLHLSEMKQVLLRHFRPVSRRARRVGDLMLLAVAADQLHLAILTERGFVHADARLRRVVETPGEPDWAIIGHYRRRSRLRRK